YQRINSGVCAEKFNCQVGMLPGYRACKPNGKQVKTSFFRFLRTEKKSVPSIDDIWPRGDNGSHTCGSKVGHDQTRVGIREFP
ncbi:hypothetical protein SB659_20140, partial [Arthrobacter sp. SIMBA_036]|uniref:hypothetical protein n=1 Tax=Arthrobacter sp. SIMBA_036 TaxID=3085778 RepID=UPI003979207B